MGTLFACAKRVFRLLLQHNPLSILQFCCGDFHECNGNLRSPGDHAKAWLQSDHAKPWLHSSQLFSDTAKALLHTHTHTFIAQANGLDLFQKEGVVCNSKLCL